MGEMDYDELVVTPVDFWTARFPGRAGWMTALAPMMCAYQRLEGVCTAGPSIPAILPLPIRSRGRRIAGRPRACSFALPPDPVSRTVSTLPFICTVGERRERWIAAMTDGTAVTTIGTAGIREYPLDIRRGNGPNHEDRPDVRALRADAPREYPLSQDAAVRHA